jgi:GNAT superfamily N-acetyltransferase
VSEEFVLRHVDITVDAKKLAELWKGSDDQWPGTWSGGVEITPQMVTEWYEREKTIDVYAFETGDKIVGYCSLNEEEGEKNVGYVGLLNVHPAYQGKSLGRRLLQRCLERCGELGFHLMTLGTWSGNLKSVPLYKKTGFFWIPDTSVWMLNFIPSILRLPCAQPYFSRHDWYRTFKRELKQAEDDERWEGMKVFTYRWKEDGEALTVWADREAHKLTAVETDAFFAAAIAENIEPAKGLSTQLRWRLKNKQDHPMSVSLIAGGNEHIQIDHRATLTVAPGETAEIEATVDIAADTPDVRRHKPVPAVRTLLILDGEVLELGTGLRPQKAVAIETAPKYVTLFPGVSKTVHLQLHSHLDQDVEATISLAPPPGLATDWTERKIAIPAKSFAGLPVTLRAAESGVYPLRATAYFAGGKTLPERLAIFSLAAGGVLADQGDAKQASPETRIENEWTRLILHPRGGGISLRASQHEAQLGWFLERLGPPFWPSELEDKEYGISLQDDLDRPQSGCVTAVMTASMDAYPGLTLRREVRLGTGPLIQVSHTLVNNGTESHALQVSRSIYGLRRDWVTLTVPLKQGIVQSRMAEFPRAPEDISKKPETFGERWIAMSSKEGTLGLMWEETIVENEFEWGIAFLSPQLTCDPQRWTPAGKLYMYAGPGDWCTVREHARRLAGTDHIPEPIPVQARPVHGARLEPAPLVTVNDQVIATLVVDNLRTRPLVGEAKLTLPQGLSADQVAFEVKEVSIEEPLSEPVTVALAPQATAYEGEVALQTRLFDTRIQVPVIRLGSRGQVAVVQGETGGQPIYTMDNKSSRFVVAPAFSGALTRWEENGVNHVLSPFPDQKTFGWMSPWYGGLTPVAFLQDGDDFPGKLYQETFAAQAIDMPDERGIPWRGVRLHCEMQREKLVGLQIELDYLTVGHSNVLKLIYRVRNATTARRKVEVGWLSFWQPDGESKNNVLRSQEIERKPTPWEGWSAAWHWGTVRNAGTGRTVILASPYPTVRLIDWGDAGGHLGFFCGVEVMPGTASTPATAERTCYLALCKSPEEAMRYTWLKDYL